MTSQKDSEAQASEGFFRDFIGSVGAHIEERLKSPFAGAFVASWLVINWKPILIIMFSSKTIEDRIQLVSDTHLSIYSVLWHPLWLSAVLTIGFYASSTIFALLIELYGVGRRWSEELFDKARWIKPSSYIELKRKFIDRTTYLEGLAADNLSIVDEEKKRTLDASSKLIEAQTELAGRTEMLGQRTEEVAVLTKKLLDLESRYAVARKSFYVNKKELDFVEQISDRLARIASELSDRAHYKNGPVANELIDIEREVDDVYSFTRSIIDNSTSTSSGNLSLQRLRDFLLQRFPGMPLNEKLLIQVHKDIGGSAGLLDLLSQEGALDRLLRITNDAVSAYKAQQPELFKSSVDILSKSLGFASLEFRKTHRFGHQTMEAFERYSHLMKDG